MAPHSVEEVASIAAAVEQQVMAKLEKPFGQIMEAIDGLTAEIHKAPEETDEQKRAKAVRAEAEQKAVKAEGEAQALEGELSTKRLSMAKLKAKGAAMTDEEKKNLDQLENDCEQAEGKVKSCRAEARKQKWIAAGADPVLVDAMAGLITDTQAMTRDLVTDHLQSAGAARLATDAGAGGGAQGGQVQATTTQRATQTSRPKITDLVQRKTLSAAASHWVSKFDADAATKPLTEQALSAAMRATGLSTERQMAVIIELQGAGLI